VNLPLLEYIATKNAKDDGMDWDALYKSNLSFENEPKFLETDKIR
jgi:hypothetical protein